MQAKISIYLCLTLLCVHLCGCSLPVSGEVNETTTPAFQTPTRPSPIKTRTPSQPSEPTVASTALDTPTPTATLAPTPVVLETLPPDLLPQPLYMLADLNGITQIWRIDPQGNRTQVTYETEDVTGFDVSPSDGALAYTLSNQLYLTQARGFVPRIVIDGAEVSDPVFSQDGSQLAYAMDGIKVFNRDSGQWTNVIFNTDINPGDVRIYTPVKWSPDGRRILAKVQLYECHLFEFITTEGVEIPGFGFGGLGSHTWSKDGLFLYLAEPAVGGLCGNEPGLWRVDARSGRGQTLIPTESNGRFQLVGYPALAPDGRLQYFLGQVSTRDESVSWDAPLRMVSAQSDGVSDRQGLRQDEYIFYDNFGFGEVLWAPDASFAIVTTITDQPPRKDAWLLKTDGSPAVFLGYLGYNLRWGVP